MSLCFPPFFHIAIGLEPIHKKSFIFAGVFNKTAIPLALVVYEMIIAIPTNIP